MKHVFTLIVLFLYFPSHLFSQDVEAMNHANRSVSYDQAISLYSDLAKKYPQARLFTEGLTDIGRPLHLFVISGDGTFDPAEAKRKGKAIFFINNGIHPGEPDGIDASVRLAQRFLGGKIKIPGNVVICIVPVYNIDGSLNSRCCTRANQDGPEKQGFRGNARNLDLNRDFIKCDSENTRSLVRLMRKWDPDVFVDTHVSNGSDYQYTITLISTQHNKLGGPLGAYMKNKMTPGVFRMMSDAGQEMSTYVNTAKYDESPENGIYGFLEIPRFGSGYAALFNCLAFVSETHMLKPFPKRVEATLQLLQVMITYTSEHAIEITGLRKASADAMKTTMDFPLSWKLDSSRFEIIPFRGFEAEYRKSPVTGMDQLYYNREKPYTRDVKFFDSYLPEISVSKPRFYVIPQAWKEVIEKMKLNGVIMTRLDRDSTLTVESYVIDDYKTGKTPYEGHYLHNSVILHSETKQIGYYKGDYLIEMNQPANRYIVETLEPQAPDSWFAWGFFDSILQQKEWFSAYVFDSMAEEILRNNPELQALFESKKVTDAEFAGSSFNQLYFIYKNSIWFEDLNRYPVGRIN